MKKILLTAIASIFAFNAFADETPQIKPQELDQRFGIAVLEWVNPRTGVTESFFNYSGTIASNTAEVLEQAFIDYPNVKKIALNSQGGIASEGYDLGNVFSNYGIEVWVPKGRICLSACAVAFVGGSNYDVQGVLGFHSAWYPFSDEEVSTFSADTVNAIYGNGQFQGVRHSHYWLVNGFSIQLPGTINGWSNPSDFLIFTNSDDLNEYYVRDDESEKDDVVKYLMWDDALFNKKVIGNSEMIGSIITKQYKDLETTGVQPTLIAIVYNGFETNEN